MRTESMKRPLVTMGVVVVAALAASAVDVKDDFESTVAAGWSGNCAVSNNVGSYAQTPPGAPIADVAHTKMLSIAGTAARSYSDDGDVSGNRVVDLLVMAEEMPDEELPEGGDDDQVKFAFDTNGCINLYHKRPDANAAQWSKLSEKEYANGQWVRVSFGFDYSSKRCQLKVDGSPLVSAYGYRSASGSETPGSWYSLANQNATALAAIDFVGCGGVDDVVNAVASTYTPSTGATTATNDVDFVWFDKNGIAWCDPNTATVASGYTVKQAFDTGIDPYSANKLYMTNVEYTASTFRLTFNGYGKTYKVETSTSPFTDGSASGTDAGGEFISSNEVANTTTWEGNFPEANGITYYRIRNASASAQAAETVNQFAIMKVASTNANTLVALPWRSLGVNTSPVTVANVVTPKNLVDGDYLLYYNGGYKGWVFSSGSWTAVSAVTTNGTLVVAPPEAVSLERGQAIWIVRTTANNRNLNDPFYLYGQYDAALVSTEVPAGGALLANPKQGAFTVSSSTISNAANGDEIRIPLSDSTMPKVLKYDGVERVWKQKVSVTTTIPGPPGVGNVTTGSTSWEAVNYTIPEGQGFMYIRKSSEETAPTVNW